MDDTRIRFEIQQPIKLPNRKTVLADLYLPQLGIFIEVNEPYHESQQQKLADEYRNKAIIDITKDKLFVIQCGISDRAGKWRTLMEIHQQIDEVVSTIKKKIAETPDLKPWNTNERFTVEYHKNKGFST